MVANDDEALGHGPCGRRRYLRPRETRFKCQALHTWYILVRLGRPHCGTTTTKHLGIGATGTGRKMMDRLSPKGLFPISSFHVQEPWNSGGAAKNWANHVGCT